MSSSLRARQALTVNNILNLRPRQAANLLRQQVRTADGGLCPLQQGVAQYYHLQFPPGASAWLRFCWIGCSQALLCYTDPESVPQLQICRWGRDHLPCARKFPAFPIMGESRPAVSPEGQRSCFRCPLSTVNHTRCTCESN